jgi:hypothetical protein
MRHRYDPDLHPTRRLPAFRVVRSHRRPRSGWPPFVGALAMIALGVTAVVVTLAASRGPTVGPVHVARPPVAGVPLVPQEVASDPPVDQGDDQGQGQGQQRGDDPASRSTPRDVPGQPPTAPAASSPAQAAPSPLLLPVPSSPPPMVEPSPSPTPSPTCGRKPPHPTRSPKVPLVLSDRPNV